jgi:hypothetical protein
MTTEDMTTEDNNKRNARRIVRRMALTLICLVAMGAIVWWWQTHTLQVVIQLTPVGCAVGGQVTMLAKTGTMRAALLRHLA